MTGNILSNNFILSTLTDRATFHILVFPTHAHSRSIARHGVFPNSVSSKAVPSAWLFSEFSKSVIAGNTVLDNSQSPSGLLPGERSHDLPFFKSAGHE